MNVYTIKKAFAVLSSFFIILFLLSMNSGCYFAKLSEDSHITEMYISIPLNQQTSQVLKDNTSKKGNDDNSPFNAFTNNPENSRDGAPEVELSTSSKQEEKVHNTTQKEVAVANAFVKNNQIDLNSKINKETYFTYVVKNNTLGFVSKDRNSNSLTLIKILYDTFYSLGFNMCDQSSYLDASKCDMLICISTSAVTSNVGISSYGINLMVENKLSVNYDIFLNHKAQRIFVGGNSFTGSILVDYAISNSPYMNVAGGISASEKITDSLSSQVFYDIILLFNSLTKLPKK